MTHTLLIWAFPGYLIIIEMIFRGISGLDTTGFIGPAIATAGLSFLLPLTKNKDASDIVSKVTADSVANLGGVIVSRKDLVFVPIVWLLILFGLLIWFGSCYYSLKTPKVYFISIPMHIVLGAINYITAAICSGIKKAL